MAKEVSRVEVTVFCPAERRLVPFIHVRLEDGCDLVWCQGCFMVAEVTGAELRCPKNGQRVQLPR